ncbi:DUF4365 domain-containing protein [Chryseobacterium indologenes]|uniref:DUF4365 domain-containing protein n=1 Tax=Chryseobacterium indologenes TaxID=253 RepID=UPI0004BC6E11|nr:DUF4365 domain-containing protein [Chryseobacterium indologenes]QPQ50181.1 DUF4365 domain-containing protein [Chryseobacterium indologenes]SFK35309.1 protein of unknown function [Chryseobacterium indologenes]SUX52774.1 Uncharacterised protein [Chryseobacterium indologenes]
MARKKQRVLQHIMEDESYQIIKALIPKENVIREFNRPDYGIDLVIELFDKIEENAYETLGEFIFVQVKSIKRAEIKREKIFPVGNVAKGKWNEDKSEYIELDVIKYSMDTNSIYTIQTLGGSVSVLLFLVDIFNQDTYFVCLNDYIDKIILPRNPNYGEQEYYTIKIPILNNLKDKLVSNNAFKFYGKRAKLLSAFSKFSYQKNEISHLLKIKDFPVITMRDELEKNKEISDIELYQQALFFIDQIDKLDIWNHNEWEILPIMKNNLDELRMFLEKDIFDAKEAREKILVMWHQLSNLGRIYEDLSREWYLPKFISLLSSYPEEPNIKKSKK